jgi:uncharacterized membrane protein YadS
VFLGGTIHDVAQVVGAGFSVSEETGTIATFTKLVRVAMLLPVVLGLAMIFRGRTGPGRHEGRVPVLPHPFRGAGRDQLAGGSASRS